jgi:hypothetical protein
MSDYVSDYSKLKKETQRKVATANKRLQRMRQQGYGNLSVIPLALREYSKITGKKADTFKIGKAPSEEKLELINRQIDKFLQSDWTTSAGRKRIVEKRKATFKDVTKWGLTEKETVRLFDLFDTDAYSKAVEKGALDSRQAIDLIREGNDATLLEKALTEVIADASIKEDETLQAIKDKLNTYQKKGDKDDTLSTGTS